LKIDLKEKNQQSIPFDENINMSFVILPDEQYVIAIKPNVQSVLKFYEKGGEPVIEPVTKKPIYSVNTGNSIQVLSIEEYQSMLEATRRKLLK
jgi:hypothetical protein